jgi:ABC-2 type transport system ATP-binding protein
MVQLPKTPPTVSNKTQMSKMTDAIQTLDLTMRYRGVTALDKLNLRVPEGAVCSLIGVNGAGKTTTIKLLINAIEPTSGSAAVLGMPSQQLMGNAFTEIGYVSESQVLPGRMTIRSFLDYRKGFYPTWDDSLAEHLLRRFDLSASRKLSQLSRGMAMKVALLSSLAFRPRLLIMDEPFTGLDPLVRDELIGGLMFAGSRMTVMISSHDLGEVESIATHIAYLDRGALLLHEELPRLSARFRTVSVRGSQTAHDGALPSNWIDVERTEAGVRFVDSAYDPEKTTAEIRRVFPGAEDVVLKETPLRSIFLTIAKQSRKAGR